MKTINIIGIDNNGDWIGHMEKPATLVYSTKDKLADLNGVSIGRDEARVLVEILNAYLQSPVLSGQRARTNEYYCSKCGSGGDGYAGTWVDGQALDKDMNMKCPKCGHEWVTSFTFHPIEK